MTDSVRTDRLPSSSPARPQGSYIGADFCNMTASLTGLTVEDWLFLENHYAAITKGTLSPQSLVGFEESFDQARRHFAELSDELLIRLQTRIDHKLVQTNQPRPKLKKGSRGAPLRTGFSRIKSWNQTPRLTLQAYTNALTCGFTIWLSTALQKTDFRTGVLREFDAVRDILHRTRDLCAEAGAAEPLRIGDFNSDQREVDFGDEQLFEWLHAPNASIELVLWPDHDPVLDEPAALLDLLFRVHASLHPLAALAWGEPRLPRHYTGLRPKAFDALEQLVATPKQDRSQWYAKHKETYRAEVEDGLKNLGTQILDRLRPLNDRLRDQPADKLPGGQNRMNRVQVSGNWNEHRWFIITLGEDRDAPQLFIQLWPWELRWGFIARDRDRVHHFTNLTTAVMDPILRRRLLGHLEDLLGDLVFDNGIYGAQDSAATRSAEGDEKKAAERDAELGRVIVDMRSADDLIPWIAGAAPRAYRSIPPDHPLLADGLASPQLCDAVARDLERLFALVELAEGVEPRRWRRSRHPLLPRDDRPLPRAYAEELVRSDAYPTYISGYHTPRQALTFAAMKYIAALQFSQYRYVCWPDLATKLEQDLSKRGVEYESAPYQIAFNARNAVVAAGATPLIPTRLGHFPAAARLIDILDPVSESFRAGLPVPPGLSLETPVIDVQRFDLRQAIEDAPTRQEPDMDWCDAAYSAIIPLRNRESHPDSRSAHSGANGAGASTWPARHPDYEKLVGECALDAVYELVTWQPIAELLNDSHVARLIGDPRPCPGGYEQDVMVNIDGNWRPDKLELDAPISATCPPEIWELMERQNNGTPKIVLRGADPAELKVAFPFFDLVDGFWPPKVLGA